VATRCTRADALRLAIRTHLEGQRLDVRALAAELGVSRMTLYRWFGDREGLIGAVLCELFDRSVARHLRSTPGRGVDRLVGVVEGVNAEIQASAALADYLNREPESALRVLTSAGSPVQARALQVWQDLLDAAVASGEVELRLDTDLLAQVLVRVGQSFLWPELLVGAAADTSRSEEVYRALLS
jgi:AcrR family transcriptional regulator